MTDKYIIHSGIETLDEILQGLRLGDNIVWQVDDLNDYIHFAQPFIKQAISDNKRCVYMRFASHPPVTPPMDGLEIITLDPSEGFDFFSRSVHDIIEERGKEVYYVFDNLSALVDQWATNELLTIFFQVTCPYLFEMDTITYFALTRGLHSHNAIAKIRDTTQILIDIFKTNNETYIHPLKVWDRYSPQMFLPHLVSGPQWQPIFQSSDTTDILSSVRKAPLSSRGSSTPPWEAVYQKLKRYANFSKDELKNNAECSTLKQEFCHMLLGRHPDVSQISENYLSLEILLSIRDRLIGSGRIGGKATGILLARAVLTNGRIDFSNIMEPHDSFYIGSDIYYSFLVDNDLFRTRILFTRNQEITPEAYSEVEKRFLGGTFSEPIKEQFRHMLNYYGQAPIIVRSSSLLEDGFENAFAGKYKSEFCPNQGSMDERLEALMKAVKLVYASTLSRDAIMYRRKRGLGYSDEQMAVLVQRVSGTQYGDFFFPPVAGVAFSRNLYAWSDRIDPEKGIVRMVFGLGTRAVDRVGGDYPRMVALSNPQLRPESMNEIKKYSQHNIDIIDLKSNKLITKHIYELLAEKDYPNLYLYISVQQYDHLSDPFSRHIDPSANLVLTFNNFIKNTDFVKNISAMLSQLQEAYGHPVDTEFTASVDIEGKVKINLLQCRPLWLPGSLGQSAAPNYLPKERVLFRSSKMISGGVVDNIKHIVIIDPRWYSLIKSIDTKKTLGRVVGKINEHPRMSEGNLLMMGPGRWGSNNIDLGVNVGYADIGNAAVLVEMARAGGGHVPEVSYGTHFFLDLVEAHIIYLPVYPDDFKSDFNEDFFANAPNILLDILPEYAEYESLVKVIDVNKYSDGMSAIVVADPDTRTAVCYLGNEPSGGWTEIMD